MPNGAAMRDNGRMTKRAKQPMSPITMVLLLALCALLCTAGWLGWVYVGSNLLGQSRQASALDEARQAVSTVADEESRPAAGEAAWVLEISGTSFAVLGGTDAHALSRGVGWYPATGLPGEAGNVVLAGHRYADGKPFAGLLTLKVGDEVVLETKVARYTYAVRVPASELTVAATDGWVLDAVPGHDFDPHEQLLTLTTQQDLVPTADRAVAFAALIKEEKK